MLTHHSVMSHHYASKFKKLKHFVIFCATSILTVGRTYLELLSPGMETAKLLTAIAKF